MLFLIKHSSVVTSEALSVISKLNKPATGFESIKLYFKKLDEELSETVVDQLVKHCQHLQVLKIEAYHSLTEEDRLNVLSFTSRIIEE